MADPLLLGADSVAPTPFAIPGATGDFRIQILNEDMARGVVTSIVHLPPGGRIPRHRHQAGSEMHFVLEGDLIEAGTAHGPGAFLTHAAGTPHGPHESREGARVLTVQQWQSSGGSFDFEPLEETPGGGAAPITGGADGAAAGGGAAPVKGGADGAVDPTGEAARAGSEDRLGGGYS